MTGKQRNTFLYFSVISVNLISFCAGSVFSWTSPVLPKLYSSDPNINPLSQPINISNESWIASLVSLGAAIGSILCAPCAQKLGRKNTLTIFSSTFLISNLLFIFSSHVNAYLVARFFIGLGTGAVFSAVPTYVAEISEDHNRGLLGCVMGVALVFGGFFNYAVGPFVSVKMLCILNLVPLLLYYISFIPFVPESPFYYLTRRNNNKAGKSLQKFRIQTDNAKTEAEKELLVMDDLVQEQSNNKASLTQLFQSRSLVNGLVLTCGLLMFQQLSGMTAIIAYMESIFEASGTAIPPYLSVIVVGALQVISNFATTILVEKLGKRLLMIISCSGNLASTICLGAFFHLKQIGFAAFNISWLPTTSLIIFMVCYNLGIGPLPWALTGEVFPENAKTIASSISTTVCLGLAFVITMIFPYMKLLLGMAGTFWFFSGCCFVSVLFTLLLMPDTKGKTLREIQDIMSRRGKV